MPKFQQEVSEVRVYYVCYTVSARNYEHAKEKIAIGDIIEEKEVACPEVLERHFVGTPERIETATKPKQFKKRLKKPE